MKSGYKQTFCALFNFQTRSREKDTVNVKVPADVYHRYFSEADGNDVQKILVEALELYFKAKGE
jgi:hypothetical protein